MCCRTPGSCAPPQTSRQAANGVVHRTLSSVSNPLSFPLAGHFLTRGGQIVCNFLRSASAPCANAFHCGWQIGENTGNASKMQRMQIKHRWYRKSALAAKLAGNWHLWPPPNAICCVWTRNCKIGSIGLVLKNFQKL